MSIMNLANSLMLDFRSLIIPRFVYADGKAFNEGAIVDAEIQKRVEELVTAAIKLDGAAMPEKQTANC
jgi:FMN reductase